MKIVAFEVEESWVEPKWFSDADAKQTGAALDVAARLMPFVNTMTVSEVVSSLTRSLAEEERERLDDMKVDMQKEISALRGKLTEAERRCMEMKTREEARDELIEGKVMEAERRGREEGRERVARLEARLEEERERGDCFQREVDELREMRGEAMRWREEACREEAERREQGSSEKVERSIGQVCEVMTKEGLVVEERGEATYISDGKRRGRLVLTEDEIEMAREDVDAEGVIAIDAETKTPVLFHSQSVPCIVIPSSCGDDTLGMLVHVFFDFLQQTKGSGEKEKEELRDHFGSIVAFQMSMHSTFAEQEARIAGMTLGLNEMKAKCLLRYRRSKRVQQTMMKDGGMSLPWEVGYEHALKMTRQNRFAWNSVTKRPELDRAMGKEAVKLAVEWELKEES